MTTLKEHLISVPPGRKKRNQTNYWCKYLCIGTILLQLLILYIFHYDASYLSAMYTLQTPVDTTTIHTPLLLPIIDKREDFGILLQSENKTYGMEIGVQHGIQTRNVLNKWTNCKKYYLIDPYHHQQNYKDLANVEQEQQEKILAKAQSILSPFEQRTELIWLRMFSTEAYKLIANNSLDFIYIDARHDYMGVTEDMELFWPKLKVNGILAGHDFCNANEEPLSNGQDWCTYSNGSKCENNKAVKGAVEDFAKKINRQIVVPRRENLWTSWYLRK
eukprot:395598_1